MGVPATILTVTPYGTHNRKGAITVERFALEHAIIHVEAGEQRVEIHTAGDHLADTIAAFEEVLDGLRAAQLAEPAHLAPVTA